MVRCLLILSLMFSLAVAVGCGDDESVEDRANSAAKSVEKTANELKDAIQEAIKDGKLEDAAAKLKELEGLKGLSDAWKTTIANLKIALDTRKEGRLFGEGTVPKIPG